MSSKININICEEAVMGDHEFEAGSNWWSSGVLRTSSGFDGNSEEISTSSSQQTQISDVAITDSSVQNLNFIGMDHWNHPTDRSSSGRMEPSFYPSMPLTYHHQVENNSPRMMFQGIFDNISDHEKPHEQQAYDQNYMINSNMCGISANFSEVSPKLPQTFLKPVTSSSNNFQLSNDNVTCTPSASVSFWNNIASANNAYTSSMPTLLIPSPESGSHAQIPNYYSKITTSKLQTKLEPTTHKKSGNSSSSTEPSFKKTRVETPSPLPAFKVRKEKLGDRITALQQLVSPFGKTDTASVLHEAIDYIKFLHDQVNVLTAPYLKNGHPMQHHQNTESKQSLTSRGLCLVPIESTYPVASETTADFWTPMFGGTNYRS